MSKINIFMLIAVCIMASSSALKINYQFSYETTFTGAEGPIEIGAEGCAVLGATGIPQFWVLSHSMTYEKGVVKQLQLTESGGAGTGDVLFSFPLDNTTLTNVGKDFTGLTFNLEGNLAAVGRRLTDDFPPFEQGVVYTFSTQGERIGGPIAIVGPMETPTDIAYDFQSRNYWMVDRDTNAIYEQVLTCCEEKNYGPLKRWEQQMKMKRVFGCEFGLQGYQNVFVKRQSEPVYNYQAPNVLRWISIPAFGDPEGIAVDPVTGNLWVVNDAPTSVMYSLTPDGVILKYYQLEQMTGYEDCKCVAATDDWLIVGFDDEQKIVVFYDKDDDDDDK